MHERVREEEKRGSAEDDNVPSYMIYSDIFCAEQSESAASDNRGWMAMPVKRLRKECRKRILPVTGRKADLAQRLPEYAVEASQRCINATIVDTSQRCIILHYRNSEPAGKMAAGHTFTVEPMICEGAASYLMWEDDWTATTRDGGRSAQFEHTLLITPDGVEALTGKIETSPVQFWERDSKHHEGVWLGTSKAGKEREAALNASLLGES